MIFSIGYSFVNFLYCQFPKYKINCIKNINKSFDELTDKLCHGYDVVLCKIDVENVVKFNYEIFYKKLRLFCSTEKYISDLMEIQ